MAIIEWGPHFLTGLGEVDRQHQGLVALANRLSEAAAGSQPQVEDAFRELTAYARAHFALEEKIMAEAGLAPEPFASHRQAHAAFVADLSDLWQARDKAPEVMTKRLLDFVTVWIYKHILITDREMAREVHALRKTDPPLNPFYLGRVTPEADD